jgi:hypothetical protein
MSGAPDNITWDYWKPQITIEGQPTGTLRRCHNLYIDENGYCYLSGCRLNNGGVIILDVATTPGTPIYVGAADNRYSHDNFSRGDTIYSAEIEEGDFSVIDATDKANPITLAIQQTSFDFAHNCWLSDDGNYLFTTDERPNAFVDAYDISDLSDIKRIDTYRPIATEGRGVIPHNTHYHQGYLVTSWYTDGLVIVDAAKPDNLVKVAAYDTFKGSDGGFSGCWGAYPFLPSGLMLASDINSGLYVFEVNLQRAAYIEGTVTDESTGFPLTNVKVEVMEEVANRNETDAMGFYRTGYHQEGEVTVRFSKAGYKRGFATVNIVSGEVTTVDITLEPNTPTVIGGITIAALDGAIIPGTQIFLQNDLYVYSAISQADGTFDITDFFPDTYQVYTGKWGYLQGPVEMVIDGENPAEVPMTEGYQDDFHFDLGWTATADPGTTSGFWDWGDPVGTTYNSTNTSNPENDLRDDFGDFCYATGNGGGSSGNDDVDDGNVYLSSPVMDLSDYENPIISYNLWFYNVGGTPPRDDQFEVLVTNGTDTVSIELINDENNSGWRDRSAIAIGGLIELTANMQVHFITGDPAPVGHIVEAAVDGFLVEDDAAVNTPVVENIEIDVQVFPNPFVDNAQISYTNLSPAGVNQLQVYNVVGQKVASYPLRGTAGTIEFGSALQAGTYFLQVWTDGQLHNAGKLIKVNN